MKREVMVREWPTDAEHEPDRSNRMLGRLRFVTPSESSIRVADSRLW